MLDNGANLGPKRLGLPYVVHGDEDDVAWVEWLPETDDLDADAALARAGKAGKSGPSGRLARRHACEEWLRGYLADGPKPAKECERAALAAGFNRGLFERARAALAVRTVRSGFGKGACWSLCLPEGESEPLDRPESDAGAHTPQIPASDSRVDYVDYVENGSHGGPAPDARWTRGTGAAPVGDEVASAAESA
jgi:hypothetical protein